MVLELKFDLSFITLLAGIVWIVACVWLTVDPQLVQLKTDSFIDEHAAAVWADSMISLLRGLADALREPSEPMPSAKRQTALTNTATLFGKFHTAAAASEFGRMAEHIDGALLEVPKVIHDIFQSQLKGTLHHTLDSRRRDLAALLQTVAQELLEHSSEDQLKLALTSLPAELVTEFMNNTELAPNLSEASNLLDNPSNYNIGKTAGSWAKSLGAHARASVELKSE